MPMRQVTPMQAVADHLNQELERKRLALLTTIAYVGERCVIHARSLPSPPIEMRGTPHQPNYIDDTGNLRSATGYVVVADGRVWKGDFENGEGGKNARNFANTLARRFPRGIVLVVVAGMNYAFYVSAKGYDVIDSAETMADRLVPQILSQLGFTRRS